jgi:predicted enzyme related to lactoylglutathione lyase
MAVHLANIVFDSVDPAAQAEFWSQVIGRPVDEGANEFFATVGGSGADPMRPLLMFIKVPEPKVGKNRLHVDLHTDDLEAEVERVVGHGAVKVGEFDEYGIRWVTLTDPEGNVFDIGTTGGGNTV